MKIRRGLGLLTLLAALMPVHAANASTDCASVSVTAPITGTVGGSPCAVPNPSGFTLGHTVYDCAWIPPAGVTGCVSVTFFTPL